MRGMIDFIDGHLFLGGEMIRLFGTQMIKNLKRMRGSNNYFTLY